MSSAESMNLREFGAVRDWTKGSVLRNLLLLSWPMVLLEGLWAVSQVIDMIWVGRLGASAMAGVGMANIVVMLVMSIDMGLIVGVRAMIARYMGAGDVRSASHVAGQAILLGGLWGALITVLGVWLARPVLGLFNLEENVVREGVAYARVFFAGWVGMELLIFGLYCIQASGDTLRPMIVEAAIRGIHLTLCPFLVLGWWVFPQMGVRGAALSNVIAQVIGAVTVMWLLFGGRSRLRPLVNDLRFGPRVVWRVLKIGIPALVMNLQMSVGNIVLMGLIASFGTLAVAGHSVASRLEMFLLVPGMGLGAGAAVLVGHNLGAGCPERAAKGAWLAVVLVEALMLGWCLVILVCAEAVLGLFSADPGLVNLGADFLRIAAVGYLVVTFSAVLQNCIAGAGDTVPNMIISVAGVWVVQLPLALALSRITSLGLYGIRWAMVAGVVAMAIACSAYFGLGRWKSKAI